MAEDIFQYKEISDAAEVYPELSGLAPGGVEIWYTKPEYFAHFALGFDRALDTEVIIPTSSYELDNTHVPLGSVAETDLDTIFDLMQGEAWSPKGEATDLIKSKGLKHTSMSVGDIIVVGTNLYMIDKTGFTNLSEKSNREE